MNDISALSFGLMGIQRGFEGMRHNADQIAKTGATLPEPDIGVVKPLVNMISDRTQVEISAKVVKAVDETIGSLLDVLA